MRVLMFTSAAWSSGYSAVIMIDIILVQNLFTPFCCVLEKDTLHHFSLLGDFGKQFQIKVMSLFNYKRTAISWHLQKQVGVIACPMY